MTLLARLSEDVPLSGELLQAGPVRVTLQFSGGDVPRVSQVSIVGRWQGGRTLEVGPEHTSLDGVSQNKSICPEALSLALIDHLWDLEFDLVAHADQQLVVRFGPGVEVAIQRGTTVTVCGRAVGPPHAMVLSGPLELDAGDAWICLSQRKLRWLSSLARVRVARAVLHPNGQVRLHGGARPGLDRAVRGGLAQASSRLSELVQFSPRFSRIRGFLHQGA